MSDNVPQEVQISPAATGLDLAIAEIHLRSDSEQSDDHDSLNTEEMENAAVVNASPPDDQGELPNMAASFGAAILIPSQIIPPNSFNIFVGIHFERFSIPMNDFRRESRFFRNNTIITSVELRYEDPAAVRLVQNWFQGFLGQPPVTKEDRDLYMKAAKIAGELNLVECESQLLVIVHKITSVLAGLISDQLDANVVLPADMIRDIIEMEMGGYMLRSAHVGGGSH